MKSSCHYTVTLTSMTNLVLDLEQNAHMFWTLTDLTHPKRKVMSSHWWRGIHLLTVLSSRVWTSFFKKPIWIGATANFTYPFIFNEPILFYGCFKRTDREEVAINGKHEATCWDLMVRLMACLVMPLQTDISIIPFPNTDQNSKEKRKILALQSVNMKEYFQAVWGRCSHQHSNS